MFEVLFCSLIIALATLQYLFTGGVVQIRSHFYAIRNKYRLRKGYGHVEDI